jgi:nucleoid DNA-binding protein
MSAFLGGVASSLKKGGKVSLVGFGTFTTSKRKARMGRIHVRGRRSRFQRCEFLSLWQVRR